LDGIVEFDTAPLRAQALTDRPTEGAAKMPNSIVVGSGDLCYVMIGYKAYEPWARFADCCKIAITLIIGIPAPSGVNE